jgi:hypothetical protein
MESETKNHGNRKPAPLLFSRKQFSKLSLALRLRKQVPQNGGGDDNLD